MTDILCGIDLSLNSTGVYFCYWMNGVRIDDYYILSNNRTKKSKDTIKSNVPLIVKSSTSGVVQLTVIDLEDDVDKYCIWPLNERKKTSRVEMISTMIIVLLERIYSYYYKNSIIEEKNKIYLTVGIEGLAFGTSSTNALCELAALNFLVRSKLEKHRLHHTLYEDVKIWVLPPSENKKFASGIGNASKDEMMFCWSKTESGDLLYNNNILKEIKIKLDDISDAYFLALCAKEKQQDL